MVSRLTTEVKRVIWQCKVLEAKEGVRCGLLVFIALSKSLISQLTGAVISLTGVLFALTMTSIENLLLQTLLNQTTIALNPTSIFQSLRLLPYTGLLGTLTAHHLLLNFYPSVSEFSSVENANQFCDFLRTVIDKHAPPSLRKVITHSSSPWFESIRDELFIANRERRQAERRWRNTKLTIFKDLYEQAKHKVSKLVHTAKCKFYTERIALASSSKELHQIVNTLSNRLRITLTTPRHTTVTQRVRQLTLNPSWREKEGDV